MNSLTAHLDILPTLVDLLGLEKPKGQPIDGISLRAALEDHRNDLPDRTVFVHVQRAFQPPKWVNSVAMTKRWRLVDGEKLFDITADPGQQIDAAAYHPDVVRRLRQDYEGWWTSLASAMNQTVRYGLGGPENPISLSSHDWLMTGTDSSAWHQSQIQRGALINGAWAVDVKERGTYEICLHRWPPNVKQPMNATEARISVGGVEAKTTVDVDAIHATFRIKLEPGPTQLQTWLTRPDGKQHGAYYTTVRLESGESEGSIPK